MTQVAVIIPLYNGAPWIQEAIDGVLGQELKPAEVVVIDDGSTDDSPSLVQKYDKVTLLHNEGKGSCLARNLGIQRTESPLIAFLDQDDVWHPAHLRLLSETLDRYKKADTSFSIASTFNERSPQYSPESLEVAPYDPWFRFPFTIGVDGPSLVMVRREALFRIGLWEEQSTGMGDALLFLKLAVLSPLLRLSSCTVGKRVHPGSQWIKVRDWGSRYLDFRLKVMDMALSFREQQNATDPSRSSLRRRLSCLRALRTLTEAIGDDNKETIVDCANLMEYDLADEPVELMPHVFYCLMGALFPIHDNETLKTERDRVFTHLLSCWPNDADRTRTAIQGLIGEMPRVS